MNANKNNVGFKKILGGTKVGRQRPIIYKKLYKDLSYEYLDKHFKHYLITGEDSWADIDKKYWIKVPFNNSRHKFLPSLSPNTLPLSNLNNSCIDCFNEYSCEECMHHVSWWDIRTLLVHITQCLNSSNMGNSYPQFPSDPFTRAPIPYEVLCQIYHRAKELQLQMHCSALAFLYTIDGRKEQLIGAITSLGGRVEGTLIGGEIGAGNREVESSGNRDVEISDDSLFEHIRNKNLHIRRNNKRYLDTDELNTILTNWLRFRNINSQDSQGNFIGIWEPKYSSLNQFERSYRQYCQHPPYIFEFGQEIANPRRKLLENLLHQLPREEWNYELDTYPAYANPCQFHPKGLRVL